MSSKTLVLVPTYTELQVLEPFLAGFTHVETRLCGFGLVEATINTFREAELADPESILLCGVAGTYDHEKCAVGNTYCFESVSQFGIGCQRDSFLLPSDLGFGSATDSLTLQPIDSIPLLGRLVSVTSSGTFSRDQILSTYGDAIAEDMEAFGFALGAISSRVARISVVRAISNEVGTPFSRWSVDQALQNLGTSLQSHFENTADTT